MENKVYTNWTEATTSASKALLGLVSCIESGRNAWIELRKNGNQDYPIKIKNPELDNHFNWTMSYGTPRNIAELASKQYFNETERDLTQNWTAVFGDIEAIEEYQTNRKILPGLCLGTGRCHPIRISDANKFRAEITKDNYQYDFWATIWKAKDNIPYHVTDENIGDVFTICYNKDSLSKTEATKKAAEFLFTYASNLNKEMAYE